jgi:predicted O-linked N-acetylglucosamine transferase (SPINDLY family)
VQSFDSEPQASLARPWFEHLDRQRYDIRLYELHTSNSPPAGLHVTMLPAELSAQVAALRKDQLDVLIFATDLTAGGNPAALIAAHRVVRRQLAVASPHTTGLSTVDYFVSGEWVEPDDAPEHYAEQLIRFSGSGLCFSLPTHSAAAAPISRQALGLKEDTIVFVSGAPAYAITPDVQQTWARLLAQVPGSILLLCAPLPDGWNPAFPNHVLLADLRTAMQRHGVAPNRLGVAKSAPSRADLLEVFKLADVCLDSFPCSAPASTLDALSVGGIVVSMNGVTRRSRLSAALMHEIGMPEIIARDPDDYVQIAHAIATDSTRREDLRRQVGQALARIPSFIDSRRFAAAVDALLRQIL